MKQPQPIIVTDLFPEVLAELLALLADLTPQAWSQPTACAGWSVHDVALHLLGGDISILARKRDGYRPGDKPVESWAELVALINSLNDSWLQATRRISPRLLIDLLSLTGEQVCTYFAGLDPDATGDPVSWAGPDPAPVWLDLAREYTERWHHQQHIRDAVGRPGLKAPKFFGPVLDTFVRALPHTYRSVQAGRNTLVSLQISGEAGGEWFLLNTSAGWRLCLAAAVAPAVRVQLDQEVAWRLFTKGIDREAALRQATVTGEPELGLKMLDTLSIIG